MADAMTAEPTLLNDLNTTAPLDSSLEIAKFYHELDTSITSPANVALARYWLQSCLECHSDCAKFGAMANGPKRLVNIQRPQQPFLENYEDDSKYGALSYTRGQSRRLLNCLHNVQSHYHHILYHQVPKTFKDV